jgi:hypothetical protein
VTWWPAQAAGLRARCIEATLWLWHGGPRDGKTTRGDGAVGSRRAICGASNGRRGPRHGGVASCARAAQLHGDGSLSYSRRIHFPGLICEGWADPVGRSPFLALPAWEATWSSRIKRGVCWRPRGHEMLRYV